MRRNRNSCWHIESNVSLAALLAAGQGTVESATYQLTVNDMKLNSPIEQAEELHNTFFATAMSWSWQLDGKRVKAVIVRNDR